MNTTIKVNFNLKYELKKKEFTEYFKTKLVNIDCDDQLYDIMILLIRSAEDFFITNKLNKKLGPVKKDAVLTTIKTLLRKAHDDKTLSNMIDSIILNNDIRPTPFLQRVYKFVKAYFRKSIKQ